MKYVLILAISALAAGPALADFQSTKKESLQRIERIRGCISNAKTETQVKDCETGGYGFEKNPKVEKRQEEQVDLTRPDDQLDLRHNGY